MDKNELRKDPVSGNWTVIIRREQNLPELLKSLRLRAAQTTKTHSCRFCEGNEAVTPPEIHALRHPGAAANERGWRVRVLPDTTPVLQIYGNLNKRGIGIYDVLDGIGAHELIVETPVHNVAFTEFSVDQIQDALLTYKERVLDLKRDDRFRYVLVHKSTGESGEDIAEHAYSHLIATPITPLLVKQKLHAARLHYQYKERCLFCDIIRQETDEAKRIIAENESFVALSPFASRAAFQMMLLPKRHQTFFEWSSELHGLAALLVDVLQKFKATLGGVGYVMVVHSGPNLAAGRNRGYWKTLEKDFHWHLEITPQIADFTTFERGSGFQVNPVPPEIATTLLQNPG